MTDLSALRDRFAALIESGDAREIRVDAGLSQPALAQLLGISPSAIARWEGGSRVPRDEVLVEYMSLMDELAGLEPQPEPEPDPVPVVAAEHASTRVAPGMPLGDLDDAGDRFAGQVGRELGNVTAAAAAVVAGATAASAVSVDDMAVIGRSWTDIVDQTLLPAAAAVMLRASEAQAANLAAAGVNVTGLTLAAEHEAAALYLSEARNRLVGVGSEVWQAAREQLVQGLQAGESVPQLAARVQEASQIALPRAQVVARTEVVSASNYGSLWSMREAGVAVTKEWIATLDGRTRDTHADVDGQVVPIGEPFIVGGARLDFPGDPAGPAEEVISCRCTLGYVVDTDAEQDGEPLAAAEFALPVPDVESNLLNVTEIPNLPTEPDPAEPQPITAADGGGMVHFEGIAVVEGEWTGDGRQFAAGGLSWPDLADTVVPLQWQKETNHGGINDVTVSVGRLTTLERDGNVVRVAGVIDTGSADGAEVVRRMTGDDDGTPPTLGGVSIVADDPDNGDVEFVWPEGCADLDDETQEDLGDVELRCFEPEGVIFHTGRIRALTVVDVPAFVEAKIQLTDVGVMMPADDPDGGDMAAEADAVEALLAPMVAAAHTISVPDRPPAAWFAEPAELPEVGAITVTDDGRFYGLLAPAQVAHRAFPDKRVTVPTGNVDYGLWMNRQTILEDGTRLATGPITMECGHATPIPQVTGPMAMDHYDNACSVVATARIGENSHGVWVAGALLPDVSPGQVARMLACQLSGDWRPHREKPGKREFCGGLLVPRPGFPVAAGAAAMRMSEGELVASAAPVRWLAAGAVEVAEPEAEPAGDDPDGGIDHTQIEMQDAETGEPAAVTDTDTTAPADASTAETTVSDLPSWEDIKARREQAEHDYKARIDAMAAELGLGD